MASFQLNARSLSELQEELAILDQNRQIGVSTRSDAGKAYHFFNLANYLANLRISTPNRPESYHLHGLEIQLRAWTVYLTPESNPSRLLRILILVDSALERYEAQGGSDDLNLATEMMDQADSVVTAVHTNLLDFLCCLSKTCQLRFERNGELDELNRSIRRVNEFQTTVDSDPRLLHLHGNTLLRRYRETSSPQDLSMGIEKLELALADANIDNGVKLDTLGNLTECYGYLYELHSTNGTQYLNTAIERGLMAVELASEPVDIEFAAGALAKAFLDRFQLQRRADDLQNGIRNGMKAKELSNLQHPNAAKWRNTLGLLYDLKFEDSGDVADLQTAIDEFEEALKLCSEISARSRYTHNLAHALGRRFEWTGETESLDHAIPMIRMLVETEASGLNSLEQANILRSLASLLLQRYKRHSGSRDLDEAIERLESAVGQLPVGHADISADQSLLCSMLTSRFDVFKRSKDILDSIAFGKAAVASSMSRGYYESTVYRNLAQAFSSKWTESHVDEDIEAAIEYSTECVQKTTTGIPYQGLALLAHGDLLMNRIVTSDTKMSPHDLKDPLHYFKQAAQLPSGLPLVRIKATRKAVRILCELGDWAGAKSLALSAMGLLPLVCRRYLDVQDQQQAIFETSGLAAEACSILLKTGEPEKALLQLEAGRAVLLGYVIDDRVDLTELEKDCSAFAERFDELKRKLQLPYDVDRSELDELKLRERRAAESAMDECLRKIRALKGHQNFLREPSIDEIRACSDEGPIVVVNMTDIRSDAILIFKSQIRSLALSEFHLQKLSDFDNDTYSRATILDRTIKIISKHIPKKPTEDSFVEWIWHFCVKLIFRELKASGAMPKGSQKPRIWWIGSGAASGFPFHAALSGSDMEGDALSEMIPSYTPSIKALLYSRRRHRMQAKVRQKSQLTIITMTTTPGYNPLPGVTKEKDAIVSAGAEGYLCRELQQPNADTALKAILDSEIVHFACHGTASIVDPSQSHVVLERDSEGVKEVDKLTVARILALGDVQRARISYLSACSTAGMKAHKLADEALHMSAALQIAGFVHVVGSLWPVDDDTCVETARIFYKQLIRSGEPLHDRAVAAALREAVLHVRQREPSSWKNWGAYIHSGA